VFHGFLPMNPINFYAIRKRGLTQRIVPQLFYLLAIPNIGGKADTNLSR